MLRLPTFRERFEYLSLGGAVGRETFGSKRFLNQGFYRSKEWRDLRNFILIRDEGLDLCSPERPIMGKVLVHHITPLTEENYRDPSVSLNPENLVCVSHITHNAIHYGDWDLLPKGYAPREAGDTKLW